MELYEVKREAKYS